MTGSTIKLREKKREYPPRPVRLTLPGDLDSELDAYRRLYADAHGREIALSDLIIEILTQFLESDRDFQRWKRGVGAARDPDAD